MEITSTNTLSQMSSNTQSLQAHETVKPQNNKVADTQQTQEIDKMSMMNEKYKNIYTPIPEDSNVINNNNSTHLSISAVLNKYAEFYTGAPIPLGKNPTQEQINQQKIAYAKVNAWILNQVGTLEANELTRFFNATVYQGLENGKSVDEAFDNALESKHSFIDTQDVLKNTNSIYEEQLISQKHKDSLNLFNEYKIYDPIDITG